MRRMTPPRTPPPRAAKRIRLAPETAESKVKNIISIKNGSNPNLELALLHILETDPVLEQLALNTNFRNFLSLETSTTTTVNCFQQLSNGILSQQISGAAAASIKRKFLALFDITLSSSFPTPQQVLDKCDDNLRSAGLSRAKVVYIKSLANAFITEKVPPCTHKKKKEPQEEEQLCCRVTRTPFTNKYLTSASDEEIVEALTRIKGIGVWSADMFLLFGLCRLDVFSTGDLGIARGMSAYISANGSSVPSPVKKWKKLDPARMLEIANPFKPYRSIFMLLMWQAASTDVSSLK